MRTIINLRLVVWQFVRLMVALEERERTTKKTPVVLKIWRETWSEIDRNLSRAAAEDADAFSELMMETEVVLEDLSGLALSEIRKTFSKVAEDLTRESRAAKIDPDQKEALLFEAKALKDLLREPPLKQPAKN
ncbi:MAG: hypothetical protein ACPGO3_11930 [Magnetospiraceae bacterium]